jgi:hypothetical protein
MIVLVVGVGLIAAAGVYYFLHVASNDTAAPERQPIVEVLENITSSEQGQFKVSDIEVRSEGTANIASGKVENTGDIADAKVTLYFRGDVDGETRIWGTSDVTIERIAKHESRDFEITIIGDYMTSDEFEIVVVAVE